MSDFGQNQKILDLLVKNTQRNKQPEAPPEPQVHKPVVPVRKEPEYTGALVDLRGIQTSSDGQLTKTRYFEMLQLEDEEYKDIRFTPEQAKRISIAMRSMSTGLNSSIPILCTGPACPFAVFCPYQKENLAPIGKSCLVEKQLIAKLTQGYIEEFDVNFNSLTEIGMVSELVEFDIYEMRINRHIAEKYPTLLQDWVSGFAEDGTAITNKDVSKVFEIKERIKKQRYKVLEALVATRKDRAKILTEAIGGNSTAEKINQLMQKIEAHNMPYIEAEIVKKS